MGSATVVATMEPEVAAANITVVMLGGGIRPSPLGYAVGSSVLDLEIESARTVLEAWTTRWRAASQTGPIRCLVAKHAAQPQSAPGGVSVETDGREYCGPAGAVRDAIEPLDDDDLLVVHEAASYATFELVDVLERHTSSGAAVSVGMNPDGSPAGLYICRARIFRGVSNVGFTDLKEQLLPRLLEQRVDVRALALPNQGVIALRTRQAFLRAALGGRADPMAFSARSRPIIIGPDLSAGASVCSPECEIAPNARVVDSVIMRGACVGEGAILVRSLVCPGVVIRAGERVVDAVATRDGLRSDAWAAARARWRQRP